MSVMTGLKFARPDHINCPIRLLGYGKNIVTSVILFPQIIFLCIEKRILEYWLHLTFLLQGWWKRLVLVWFFCSKLL